MKNLLLSLASATLLLPASANFHLWDFNEVYSNADGSVQFIEFSTTTSGQEVVAGHTLTFQTNSLTVNTFTFPTNTGTPTANKTFLVGTANLSAILGVTPDFVISAQFFAPGATNTLNFEGATDVINLGSLPTNGSSSLDALALDSSSSAFAINAFATPKNFAGQTVTVPEPSTYLLLLAGLGVLLALGRRIAR